MSTKKRTIEIPTWIDKRLLHIYSSEMTEFPHLDDLNDDADKFTGTHHAINYLKNFYHENKRFVKTKINTIVACQKTQCAWNPDGLCLKKEINMSDKSLCEDSTT